MFKEGAITQLKRNVFTLSGACFPEGATCLLHSTGGFSDPVEEEVALLFPQIGVKHSK